MLLQVLCHLRKKAVKSINNGFSVSIYVSDIIIETPMHQSFNQEELMGVKFDGLVKSIQMAKEKGPYTRFSDLPGLK